MSGIFVDEKDRIEIEVSFKVSPEGGKLEILPNKEPGCESLTVKFAIPDYQMSQRILQTSMKPTPEGGLTMDIFIMQQSLLMGLAREWDAKDKDGKEIPLTATALGNLKIEVARTLISKLMDRVGGIF